jgi:glycosyltransferase involved in cell wall biosynthesis
VAEAVVHGVPVVASTGTPWKRLEETGSGLWVDYAPNSLAAAIEAISRMSLREMGARGRAWMQREFSRERRARGMVDTYLRLINCAI